MFEKRTTGVAFTEYSLYPVLLPVPTQNVLGYHELRGSIGVERSFGRLFVGPEYGVQANFPFDYLGTTTGVDRIFISYASVFTYVDFRDDPLKPLRGSFFSAELQRAGGPLQGDANDFKVQPEARFFVPLPKNVVFASRATVGLLFPFNYSQYSEINFRQPGPSRLELASRDYQLLYFRGFFGGGPSSNRGYPLRAIGPYAFIPYLSPAGQSVQASGCDPSNVSCLLPTGGLTLWEASLELRVPMADVLSGVVFCDAGDVSPFRVDLRFNRPHLSCGVGGRYVTPVGPVRLDVGYRIPHLQFFRGPEYEREPDPLFGLPIAISIAIGEAF
jgi:outer membrane protein insertion porin family/translocation and assembly module TamA